MKRVFISYGDEKTVRLQSDNPDKKSIPMKSSPENN